MIGNAWRVRRNEQCGGSSGISWKLVVIVNDDDNKTATEASYRPGGGKTICPPPVAVDLKIAADLRPSADGSTVRTSLVAGGG